MLDLQETACSQMPLGRQQTSCWPSRPGAAREAPGQVQSRTVMLGVSGVESCFGHESEVITTTMAPDLTGAKVLQRKTGGHW